MFPILSELCSEMLWVHCNLFVSVKERDLKETISNGVVKMVPSVRKLLRLVVQFYFPCA